MSKLIKKWTKEKLVNQLLSVQERTSLNLPRKDNHAKLPNIDYYAHIEPYDACVGGDHLVVIDFKNYLTDDNQTISDMIADARKSGREEYLFTLEKSFNTIGMWIADTLGHDISASIPNTYLHGAFQIGVDYELLIHGEVTSNLFNRLNRKFYDLLDVNYLSEKPYVTTLYGEIHNSGKFRFLSAGHPLPLVFSNKHNKLVSLDSDSYMSSTPLGVVSSQFHPDIKHFSYEHIAKKKNQVNEITLLGKGDILILYTDGWSEQKDGDLNFCESKLEQVLQDTKVGTAKQIYTNLRKELQSYYPPSDDLTMVVIKKV